MKNWITKSHLPAHKRETIFILARAAGIHVWAGVYDYNDDKRYVYYNASWDGISIVPFTSHGTDVLTLDYEEVVAILEDYIKQQLKKEVKDGHS